MANITWKLNNLYKFNTIAPGVLGNSYANMKLKAMMSYDQAVKEADVLNIHNQIRNTVSNSNLPTSAKSCTFLKFASQDETTSIFALEYLSDVEEVTTQSLIITINNYTPSDYSAILTALNNIGYFDLSMETKNL